MGLGERQKKNLQVLQDLAISTHNFRVGGADKDDHDSVSTAQIPANASAESDCTYGTSSTIPYSAASLDFLLGETTASPLIGSARPPSNFLDSSQQLQPISASYPNNPDEINIVSRILGTEDLGLNQQATLQLLKKIPLKRILEAGINALLQESAAEAPSSSSQGYEDGYSSKGIKLRTDRILKLQNLSPEYVAPLPNLRQNHIRMKQILFVAACAANASILGVTLGTEDCENVESPFFREMISESAAKTACLSDFTSLKTHLRPSPVQLLHSHHPYIDVLPFPTFRDRVIKLACTEEPMIDEDDLCEDLQKDGLICWGSSLGGGSAAMGSGAPWDIRSWEAQPWFLKKWWILIGGAEGEIYKQTQWWCDMRGEKSCYPW